MQIDGIAGCSGRLKNIVRRHRFQIPKHLIELCLNACSVPESQVSSIKKHLQEMSVHHPVRNLS